MQGDPAPSRYITKHCAIQCCAYAWGFTGLLGLGLGLLVVSDTVLELLLAAGGLDVLDAHVDALSQDTALDLLVHQHADSGLGDVPHAASAAVVVPVGHTLVDGTVDLDVHEVTQLVGGQVSLHGGKAMVAKPLGEHVARVATHATSPTAPHLCRSHTHAHATLSLLISFQNVVRMKEHIFFFRAGSPFKMTDCSLSNICTAFQPGHKMPRN